jgi:hypothetical protein
MMGNIWGRWMGRFKELSLEEQEKIRVLQEIRAAQRDWKVAQEQMNYVKEMEQIDYAISMLETAEKRYAMLLRQAKKLQLNVLEVDGTAAYRQYQANSASKSTLEG